MGVTITLVEITRELWDDKTFHRWLADGVEVGEIPLQIPDFRTPKLSDIEAILKEFNDIDVEQRRQENQMYIIFSKLLEQPINIGRIVVYHEFYELIYFIFTSTIDNSDPFVNVVLDKSSGERINKFVQLLANRCGVFLLLENGEPVQFFVPQTTE